LQGFTVVVAGDELDGTNNGVIDLGDFITAAELVDFSFSTVSNAFNFGSVMPPIYSQLGVEVFEQGAVALVDEAAALATLRETVFAELDGVYSGMFGGERNGNLTVYAYDDGTLAGIITFADGNSYDLNGTISLDGGFSLQGRFLDITLVGSFDRLGSDPADDAQPGGIRGSWIQGGDSGTFAATLSATIPPLLTPQVGVFQDDVVAGLRYQLNDQGPFRVTSAAGEFLYQRASDTISFYVGDIYLGKAQVKSILTPSDLAFTPLEEPLDRDVTLLALVRFLQSADRVDGAPGDGVIDLTAFTAGSSAANPDAITDFTQLAAADDDQLIATFESFGIDVFSPPKNRRTAGRSAHRRGGASDHRRGAFRCDRRYLQRHL
jgi:hypothetical protein